MKKKIVIVGGVAGGATAAARLRRISEDFEIILFEKDENIAFANCGLPYYVSGKITNRDSLLVQTVSGISQRYNVDVRNFSKVIKVNSDKKNVIVENKLTEEIYEETYDVLLLAPGAQPIVPNFPSINLATNVYTLRNIPDIDRIKESIQQVIPKQAVVVGGGFIGVEMAENLAKLGIKVTLIDAGNHILRPFDLEMASMLELELKQNNVELILNKSIEDIEQNFVTLSDGSKIETELTVLAIGVKANTNFLAESGIELNRHGAIVVNESLQTNIKEIYAVGDAIETMHYVDSVRTTIPLAWPANRQARLVADIISGINVKYNGTLGASIIKVFNLTAASVGYTAEMLEQKNIDFESIIVHRSSHASYYPNSSIVSIKLIFDKKTKKIYGGQAVGSQGVDKRIDILSVAMKANMTVDELSDLELCYAPPYNSAKDPINIAGYAADNIIKEEAKIITYLEFEKLIKDSKNIIIDVRNKEELSDKKIENTTNIPLDCLREEIEKLDLSKESPIYVFCQVGARGYTAQRILMNLGYKNVYNLSGGIKTYNCVIENKKDGYERD